MKRFETLKAYLVCLGILSVFMILQGCSNSNGAIGGGHWNKPVRLIVTPVTASIPVSGTLQYMATAVYGDGSTIDRTAVSTWTSGSPGVATIGSNTGLATGVAPGTSVITATYAGMTANATLTVNAATSVSFVVIPAAASIPVTGNQQFTAIETFSDGSTFNRTAVSTWTSGTPGVATVVVNTGLAVGVTPGVTIITATFGAQTSTATLTVNAATSQSFVVIPATATIAVSGTQQFAAIEIFSDGSTFNRTAASNWTSGTPGVATVGLNTGLATGVTPGISIITATFGVRTATATLTVTAATSVSFRVTPSTASTGIGGAQQFAAIETFSDGTTIDRTLASTWSSGTPGVATVGLNTGIATGVAAGSSTITATFGIKTGSGTLTVTGGPGSTILGTASTYGLIASTAMTISSIPQTHIYGDVALTANDAFTGFAFGGTIPLPTSPFVTPRTIPGINSTVRGSVAAAAQAQIDLAAAYADLSGRVPTVTYPAGATQLSGQVLTPGIYRAGAPVAGDTFALDNSLGPLVLDAQGNPDALFIFQANDITTTTGSVILQNGAQPKNVYWVMTATATIGNGASSIFQGTVVSGLTITVNGANVQGRMLAGASGTGALTIAAAGSVITVPF